MLVLDGTWGSGRLSEFHPAWSPLFSLSNRIYLLYRRGDMDKEEACEVRGSFKIATLRNQ